MATTQTVSAKANIYNPQDNQTDERYKEYVQNTTTSPRKIFICEDTKHKTVDLWRHFFRLANLPPDIIIDHSGGCDNDEVEISIRHTQKSHPAYKPIIFRQYDRDGLTVEQVEAVTKSRENKWSKISSKYKVSFLPVAEIENFALISENNNIDISNVGDDDEFMVGVEDKCLKFASIFKNQPEEVLFSGHNYHKQKILIKMRNEAISNPTYYFPGKKFIGANNGINILLKLKNYTSLPKELKNYLDSIKNFFEDRAA